MVEGKATSEAVAAHAGAIRSSAIRLGLSDPGLRQDGTVVVHSDEVGYRAVTRLSAAVSYLVGAYVHVITDDLPGAANLREL